MLWLTQDEVIAQGFQVRGSPTPQVVDFPADLENLSAEIPVPPSFEEQGFIPGPSYQWYGRIGNRCVILEREKEELPRVGKRVVVYTSYLEQQDKSGDWTVLFDLSALPSAIFVTRPNFIMSRVVNPEDVVFRPNPSGWNAAVYNASSRSEAEELLKFLKQDRSNGDCFIGPPEPQGLWSAVQEDEGQGRVLCTYPVPSAAISFACDISSRTPSGRLIVKDNSNANATIPCVTRA